MARRTTQTLRHRRGSDDRTGTEPVEPHAALDGTLAEKLDEPSLGLAPTVVESLYDTLQQLHEEGLTLLLAEQSIPLALGIADYAYVLQTGRVAIEGKAAEMESNRQVQEIYLGIGTRAELPS